MFYGICIEKRGEGKRGEEPQIRNRQMTRGGYEFYRITLAGVRGYPDRDRLNVLVVML